MPDSLNDPHFFRMPKREKKEKQRKGGAVTAKNGDDLESMLAKFRAADLAALEASSDRSAKSNESNYHSASAASSNRAPSVSDDTITKACIDGDFTRIRIWGRQGVRLVAAIPFCSIVVMGRVDVMRCMVKELGADVHRAHDSNVLSSPLFLAAKGRRVDMIRALAELGADIN
jgi:hypothetical protein